MGTITGSNLFHLQRLLVSVVHNGTVTALAVRLTTVSCMFPVDFFCPLFSYAHDTSNSRIVAIPFELTEESIGSVYPEMITAIVECI